MVTAGGRNFYGGILARDSFNGLRLWHRDLKQGENNPKNFELPRLSRDGARPVVSDQLVFTVLKNRPVALNAATGEVVAELGDMVNPKAIVHDSRRVIAADGKTIRAFHTDTGKQIWNVPADDPRNVIADGQLVAFIQGQIRRGDKAEVVVLEGETGNVKWRNSDFSWLARTTRTVMSGGQLVFEVSTLNDHDAGNGIHVVAAETGKHLWSKEYPPGMNHARQARAMFLENDLWILHGGKINTNDEKNRQRQPVQISALDPLTGKVRVTHPAGLTPLFSAGGHAEFHVRRGIGHDESEVGRSHREPHYQSQLLPGEWMGPCERTGLHHSQTLHVLADAARLRGHGPHGGEDVAGQPPARTDRIPLGKRTGQSRSQRPRTQASRLATLPSRPLAEQQHGDGRTETAE